MITRGKPPQRGALKQPLSGPIQTTLIKRLLASADADRTDATAFEDDALLAEWRSSRGKNGR